MTDDEYEQVGWGYEWPEGSPIQFSFMRREPLDDVEKWFPIYREVEDSDPS